MSTVADREVTIELPGVPASQHSFAEREIRVLLDWIKAATERAGTPFLVKRICVTDRFEDEVRCLLRERSGDTSYEAARSHVHAIGKTLWVRSEHGDIEFVVVIDGRQTSPWEPNNPRWRTTVLHELFHVFLEGSDLATRGEDEYVDATDTRERWLHRWATRPLDEFTVNSLVDHFVRSQLANGDGQPWSLRELEEADGADWVPALLSGLDQMPETLDSVIWRFRTRRIGIEQMAEVVIPEVNDLLTLLAHTASLCMDTPQWPDIVNDIKETKSSRRFLGEHLDSILEAFDNPQLPFEESVQIVERAVEGIFRRCGLGFRTVPEGVYISVEAPSP